MKLVIVESPTKAKTIGKYLGKDYVVIASFGHVRDLPSKDGSVKPEADFEMMWATDARSAKHIKVLVDEAKKADEILLATDPDREGEAISWHVLAILKEKKALKKQSVKRVVFHEITKRAINEAIENPRELDQNLIDAYLARRALDYLVGFNLSPVLWRKLPGSKSAGRVQSVALRLITDRENEIEAFNTQEYWSIIGDFTGQPKKKVSTRLIKLDGKKLDKFDINSEILAKDAIKKVTGLDYTVDNIDKKQVKRNPAPPFTTSTLQQEASRKLGFTTSKTMRLAQQLYEGINLGGEVTGLITYMRTDSVNTSKEAQTDAINYINNTFGKEYLPEAPREFKGKAKNAQEAHEAIRPTLVDKSPADIETYLDKDQFKLYSLIWKRMVASQMANALLDQVAIDISDAKKNITFRANGTTVAFDGFFKVYKEGQDDETSDDDEKILPAFTVGEILELKEVTPNQHFTLPPPRYTEASLIKKLEELGIGRPSTYSSIVQTLILRKYTELTKKQFHPTDRGRIVTAFLANFFENYIQYSFTADLEDLLDDVAHGKIAWKKVMSDFWEAFIKRIEEAKGLSITNVIDILNKDLETMLFPEREDGKDRRICPKCDVGELSLKLGKFGAFVGCSNYPECTFTRKLGLAEEGEEGQDSSDTVAKFENHEIGKDPKTGEIITLRKGPYGFYFQWGEQEAKSKIKPKRASLPKGMKIEDATLEKALEVGALPRNLGVHPDTHEELIAAIGRFGPYIKHGTKFVSVKGDDNVYTITLERAIELVNNVKKK